MIPETFSQAEAGDLRFQFEVIKNLAESVRSLTETVRGVQSTQITMLERLARIESNRVNEDVARLQAVVDRSCERIDSLESDKDKRDGGSVMRRAIVVWWPVIAATGMVLWLLARSSGIIHMPADNPTVIMAPPAAREGR